ncbi:AraC family transcriptional regulator [Luteimonas suaedae]|uniref:AraC family transcriptional regulator n=1 Tax=Luteimonas suaedae TaxID=2605430 RepID=UPI001CA936CE|nr:helix-turn-helix transcriptional regulator [Luteimonas suaedae]
MKHSQDYPLKARPMIGLEDEYPAGFVDPRHCHAHAQFLYACAGVMSVVTPQTSFVIPPQRAVWLPAEMVHEVSCRGAVSLRTLYIDPLYDTDPNSCRVLEVSDFLKALVLEVVKFPAEYDLEGREGRIVHLLLDEIRRMPSAPYHVPMPTDPRLVRLCKAIIANPADHRDIDALSSLIGMSRRTFTRAFKQELGMGFALWRQQVRLMAAVSLLAAGRTITSVALEVGYESPSAFTAMFHRAFGEPPSAYASR